MPNLNRPLQEADGWFDRREREPKLWLELSGSLPTLRHDLPVLPLAIPLTEINFAPWHNSYYVDLLTTRSLMGKMARLPVDRQGALEVHGTVYLSFQVRGNTQIRKRLTPAECDKLYVDWLYKEMAELGIAALYR